MNLPISFRDRVDVEETVLPTFLDQSRRTFVQAFAIDATVDHNMGYMDAQWPILARHALRDHAQAPLWLPQNAQIQVYRECSPKRR